MDFKLEIRAVGVTPLVCVMRSGRIFASDRIVDGDLSKLKAAFVERRENEDYSASEAYDEFAKIVDDSGLDFTPVERVELAEDGIVEIQIEDPEEVDNESDDT